MRVLSLGVAGGLSVATVALGVSLTAGADLSAQRATATGGCVGTITDTSGRPLWAVLHVDTSPGARARPPSPEEVARRMKMAVGHVGGVSGTTTSLTRTEPSAVDETGRFEVPGLPAGTAFLGLEVAGEVKRIVTCDVRPATTTSVGQISLDVGGVVQGRVAGPTGAPLTNVSILLRDASPRLQRVEKLAVTDARGRFVFAELDVGQYVLLGHHSDWGDFSQVMNTGTEPARITMAQPGRIVARVESSSRDLSSTYEVSVSLPNTGRAVVDTTSGADVQLSPIQPGRYIVSISTAVDQPSITTANVDSGDTTDLGVIHLNRGLTLHGVVRSTVGTPVEGARVGAESDVDQAGAAATDPEGHFELRGLPSSRVRLTVKHPDYVPRPVFVEMANSVAPVSVEVVLEPGASIRGRARQRDGSPVPGAPVSLVYDVSAPGDDALAFAARSDAEGRFWIRGIPPGRAMLTVDGTSSRPRRSVRRLMTLNVPPAGLSNVDVVLEPIRVTGHVIRRDGTPIEGVRLSIVPQGFDPMRVLPNAVSDAAGAFRADVEALGTMAVSTRDADGRQLTSSPSFVTLDGRVAAALRIVVEDGVTLSGSVVRSSDQSAVTAAHVVASSRASGKMWQTFADGHGRFSLVVEAGEYDVQADAPQLLSASRRVSVVESGADVTLELAAGGRLAVRVLSDTGQPSAGALVSLATAGRRARGVAATDKDGAYTFEGLPDESLALLASNTFGSFTVKAGLRPDTGDVAVALAPGAEFELSVVRADGRPAGNAAVHIVEVDGLPVADFSFARVDQAGRVTLFIPSGTVIVEVVDPSATTTLRLGAQSGEHIVRTVTLR